ncbi:peptide-methionine (R)-S-oxide reductase MsrB [Flavobacterium pallidum]|uniref:peptide-methionine (R)-S-oxide reductase n=1 Tax=Flavobacterium pallidum TaxID=2172098 RepID=A0A2S1SKF4_9FLAO|nr:peptide-methionine (R)-S-oxide reductase MsrB [Flavobacterium pallidum]AWI26890.1 peptide-methionine (R)-S-oxide reductase [Flavobacterium pallidum]
MKKYLFLCVGLFGMAAMNAQEKTTDVAAATVKTDAEWKKQLTPEQYEVLRNKGTEKAFTGKYVTTTDKGTYVCAACSNPLFDSESKFKSDAGWPTFDRPIKDAVTFVADDSTGTIRTEVVCSRCDGHLGHVTKDASAGTSGARYTVSSVALKFVAAK